MNDIIRDLVTDIRFSRRLIKAGMHVEENQAYQALCLAQLQKAWAARHTANSLNRYGWPKVLEN